MHIHVFIVAVEKQ